MFACSGHSRVPAPRPIDSIVSGREGGEPLDDGGEDGGAGRRGHLALDHRLGQRDAAEQLGRGRGRQGHPAVSRLDPAATGRHRAGLEPIDTQQVEADRRADDVDDRIDRADLVEMDLGQVDPVDLRLGLAELEEDPLGQVLLPGRQDALVDDRFDVMPVAMGVLVRRDDLGIGRAKAAATDRLERQLAGQPQAGHGLLDRPSIDAGIDQRRHRHVAGNAAETIEIADSHALTPCHEC